MDFKLAVLLASDDEARHIYEEWAAASLKYRGFDRATAPRSLEAQQVLARLQVLWGLWQRHPHLKNYNPYRTAGDM